MLTPDDVKDIVIVLIGGLFGGGLIFIVNWYKAKQAAELAAKQEKDKHEIDSGKLAIELMQAQRQRIDQLTERVSRLEKDLTTQREAGLMKDARIAELERKTAEQEEEILELRKIIADKDEIISRLNARLDTLEKGRLPTGRAK